MPAAAKGGAPRRQSEPGQPGFEGQSQGSCGGGSATPRFLLPCHTQVCTLPGSWSDRWFDRRMAACNAIASCSGRARVHQGRRAAAGSIAGWRTVARAEGRQEVARLGARRCRTPAGSNSTADGGGDALRPAPHCSATDRALDDSLSNRWIDLDDLGYFIIGVNEQERVRAADRRCCGHHTATRRHQVQPRAAGSSTPSLRPPPAPADHLGGALHQHRERQRPGLRPRDGRAHRLLGRGCPRAQPHLHRWGGGGGGWQALPGCRVLAWGRSQAGGWGGCMRYAPWQLPCS